MNDPQIAVQLSLETPPSAATHWSFTHLKVPSPQIALHVSSGTPPDAEGTHWLLLHLKEPDGLGLGVGVGDGLGVGVGAGPTAGITPEQRGASPKTFVQSC